MTHTHTQTQQKIFKRNKNAVKAGVRAGAEEVVMEKTVQSARRI